MNNILHAKFAYHCRECHILFMFANLGHCPQCQGDNILPFSWYLLSQKERQNWLQTIQNNKG